MKRIIRSGTSSEYDGPGLTESKRRALLGALFGGALGGVSIYLLFSIFSFSMETFDGRVLVVAGTLAGIGMGLLFGILISLRLWHSSLDMGRRLVGPMTSRK